jgi:hypothetical protein
MSPTWLTGAGPWILQILLSAFFAILFLQSGLDKVIDRRGNLDFLKGHFERTPLAKQVPMMFFAITVLEVLAGVLSGIGCVAVVFAHSTTFAFWGAVLAAIALLGLFFGQRVSKDYEGAATLVPYFLAVLAAIWVLG